MKKCLTLCFLFLSLPSVACAQANVTVSGNIAFTGASTMAQLNGVIWYDGVKYTSLQSAANAACNGTIYGELDVPPGTFSLSSVFNPPSNCEIRWHDTVLTNGGFTAGATCSGADFGTCTDVVWINGSSNVAFKGRLTINANANSLSVNANGFEMTNASNITMEDVEVTDSKNACFFWAGVSHVQAGNLRCDNMDALAGASSPGFNVDNNGTTPSANVQVTSLYSNDTRAGGSGAIVFGSSSTPNVSIQLGQVYVPNSPDNGLEYDFSSGSIDSVIGGTMPAQVLLLRQTSDVSVGSVQCLVASKISQCVGIGTFGSSDGPVNRIRVGSVVGSGVNGTSNNPAVLLIQSGAGSPSSVQNITVGQVIAANSTTGVLLSSGASGLLSHLTINSIIAHHNQNEGVGIYGAQDVVVGSLVSYDNNQANNGSFGSTDGIDIDGPSISVLSANVYVASARIFDDQGTKTQLDGFWIGANSSLITLVGDFNPTNAKVGNFDGGSNDSIQNRLPSGFASTTLLRSATFVADQGTPCTNGELALSAGWGNGPATVTGAIGQGQTCEWTITSVGTGQVANPTITDMLTNALPSANVVCGMRMTGGTGSATLIDQTSFSATAPIFTFGGTPAAGSTYKVVRRCGP